MNKKIKWIVVGIALYGLFLISNIFSDYLAPSKVTLPWTIFWYVIAFGIAYFFAFKNYIFERTMYYAKQLNLTKDDLTAMLPKLKKNQEVPDPQKRHLLSPSFNFSLQNLDILDDKLIAMAKEQKITPFQ